MHFMHGRADPTPLASAPSTCRLRAVRMGAFNTMLLVSSWLLFITAVTSIAYNAQPPREQPEGTCKLAHVPDESAASSFLPALKSPKTAFYSTIDVPAAWPPRAARAARTATTTRDAIFFVCICIYINVKRPFWINFLAPSFQI